MESINIELFSRFVLGALGYILGGFNLFFGLKRKDYRKAILGGGIILITFVVLFATLA